MATSLDAMEAMDVLDIEGAFADEFVNGPSPPAVRPKEELHDEDDELGHFDDCDPEEDEDFQDDEDDCDPDGGCDTEGGADCDGDTSHQCCICRMTGADKDPSDPTSLSYAEFVSFNASPRSYADTTCDNCVHFIRHHFQSQSPRTS